MSDGTETTVDKTRFDGLMSAHQKALSLLTPEQRASLKEQPADPAQQAQRPTWGSDQDDDLGEQTGAGGTAEGSQYEEGGQYTFEGGAFVPFEPPTPMRHNGAREQRKAEPDELPELSKQRPEWTLTS